MRSWHMVARTLCVMRLLMFRRLLVVLAMRSVVSRAVLGAAFAGCLVWVVPCHRLRRLLIQLPVAVTLAMATVLRSDTEVASNA